MKEILYVCLPHGSMEESARIFTNRHLLDTILLADALIREFSHEGEVHIPVDTGNLNRLMWGRNTMSLARYGEVLLAEAKTRGIIYTELIKTEMFFKAYIDNTARWPEHYSMTMPPWTESHRTIKAHQAYLKYLDLSYGSLWPELEPILLPIPSDGGLSVYGSLDMSSLW